MMKKVLAFVLVLMLVLGTLAVTATANNADEVDYRVGYAKTDLNPYWSVWEAAGNEIPKVETSTGSTVTADHIMPLPMGGYGGNAHRLSRPELVDDNGSGNHASGVVYLSNNRYTQAFAKEMLGDGTDAYNAYAAKGFGQNDGDGIYGTCVAIQQNPSAEPILYFSVDFIGMADTYCGQAKMIIINELKKIGISTSPDRILINATHTHGSVALGESFADSTTYYQKLYGNTTEVGFSGNMLGNILSTYRKYIYTQLAAAAVQALTEGQTNGSVTMRKGTIDVSDATGYQLNGVRHVKAEKSVTLNGETQTVQYVTGSSFNVFSGDDEFDAVSDSDDRLHVLEFSFPDNSGVKPILMINWRAHTTANNKMNTKAHNNLSADFVAAMRWQLEQWGYRPILSYSASGNLGMGDTPGTYNISTTATTTTMNGTKYGYALAYAAITQVRGVATSSSHPAYSYRNTLMSTLYSAYGSTYRNQVRDFRPDAMVTCTQGPILLESIDYDVKHQGLSTDGEYLAALYHDALATQQGSKASDDGGLKVKSYPLLVSKDSELIETVTTSEKDGVITTVTTTISFTEKRVSTTKTKDGELYGTQPADEVITNPEPEKSVVFASQYHSNAVKNRHGAVNTKRISLCAFTLGDQVAFVTMPFEASDRYSMEAKLTTANDYNDWENLVNEEKWGTPFVVSLMNGTEGYFPNNLAYTYQGVVNGQNYNLQQAYIEGKTDKFVNGSYEAHIAYAAPGQGEAVVEELNQLLRGLSDEQETPATKTGYCEACKKTVTWTQMLTSKQLEDYGNNLPSGHYYLTENYTNAFGAVTIYMGQSVCLDLNGYTYYADSLAGGRAFGVYDTLNLMDSRGGGVLQSDGNNGTGGTIIVGGGSVLNLYSGTITCTNEFPASSGGCIYVNANGTFNMYGGTVSGGNATTYGGNVQAQGGTFNMYGGTITGGKINGSTSAAYANLMISGSPRATFRYVGGYIPSGAFMQGTMYLGSPEGYPANTSQTTTVSIRNTGTVTLDGIFTAKVKLDYSNTKNPDYVAKPTSGDTIGAVTPGSWIDYVGGAKITAQVNTGYQAVVSGDLLKLGTAPAIGYCDMCQTNVVWMPMVQGAVNGHFALTGSMTGMEEQVIPAYGKLCLDLNGKTYSAAGRAFTVEGILNVNDTVGGGTLQGTAVASQNGGTVYVAANGAMNQYGGTVTCDHSNGKKLANGGVVFVTADGSYTMNGGTLSGGYASNGGNLYVAANATAVLNSGTISGGQTSSNGGNVYTAGTFTMNGGAITSGTANYGGNVQVQDGAAYFTMTGGTISGGTGNGGAKTAEICTSTNSHFRMEGGYVAGNGAYVQGYAVLTGTTDGNTNVSVKVPHERLTIEGIYTGNINLTFNGSTYTTGDKIGISANADLTNAVINIVGDSYSENYVAVVGDELRLGSETIADIAIKTYPNKMVYWPGEALDKTGLTLTVTYEDGLTNEIDTGFTVTGFDAAVTGDQALTVTYAGFTTTFTVHVRALTGIAISAQPNKTNYFAGEALNTTGLTLTATYSDGYTMTVTEGFEVTGFDSVQTGDQALTVTYEGFTAAFTVHVRALAGIVISAQPGKTTYIVGESLDTTGLTLTATYSDGYTKTVTAGFNVTGFDANVIGEQTLTVAYEGFTATFVVTVEDIAGDFIVGNEGYTDLEEALAAASSTKPLILRKDLEELTLSKTTYLDLNGHTVASVATGSWKLYVMDAATADYDVADGIVGKVLAADNAANVKAATGYMVENNAGILSFHKFVMNLTDLVVNTEKIGITYKAAFHGDQFVKSQIAEFGVALRAYTAPNSTSIWADPDCKTHVAMQQSDWQIGAGENGLKCVYVSGILDENETTEMNSQRAQVQIYGCTYVKLTDGTMLFGDVYNFSLKTAMQHMDYYWNTLSQGDQAALKDFYGQWKNVMSAWADIDNIKAIDLPA